MSNTDEPITPDALRELGMTEPAAFSGFFRSVTDPDVTVNYSPRSGFVLYASVPVSDMPQLRRLISALRGEEPAEVAELRAEVQKWADAYPLDAFPEPDLQRADEALKQHGLSLMQISAHVMREASKSALHIVSNK